MVTRYLNTLKTDKLNIKDSDENRHSEAGNEEICRCKEVSKMTPRELMQLMIDDLAFWKKGEKNE